jgi:hypothetical protein
MRLPIGLATACLIAAAVPAHAQVGATSDSSFAITGTTFSGARDSIAQASVVTPSTPATAPAGPTRNGLRAGVHRPDDARPLVPYAAATNPHLGQARALMVVGAAALITGAIIGGDPGTIIMVGGAVIGLYGLYQYLQ